MDDKLTVIVVLAVVAICLCFVPVPKDNLNVLNSIITGLFGVAVGKYVQGNIK